MSIDEESNDFVLIEHIKNVAVLTLNRPHVMNAWHKPMRDQLITKLNDCENDPNVAAIVVSGAGDRAFCAGQDLKEVTDFDADAAKDWIEEWRVLYHRVRTMSKPTVAALNGVAAGSGFQFALLMDIRIGHSQSRMGQPEINAGIASITGSWIMREILGLARTTELVLTGRIMDGVEAHKIGLIHELVDQRAVLSRATELANELGAKAPLAMKLNKNWLRQMTQPGFDATFEHASAAHAESYDSGEPQSASRSFLNRRE